MTPHLADGEGGGWAALGMAAGALIAAIATALVQVWREKRRIEKDRRADALAEWQDIAIKLESQHERYEKVIDDQQKALEAVQRVCSECREECAELRADLHYLHDYARRLRATLVTSGHDPGEVPEIPTAQRHESANAEFLARQAAQSATLVQEASKTIPPVPPSSQDK